MIHRLTDPNDPGCFLWSDGAGAAVLEGGALQGFVGAAFQADDAYASGWGIAAGGTSEPASVDAVKAGRTQMRHVFLPFEAVFGGVPQALEQTPAHPSSLTCRR